MNPRPTRPAARHSFSPFSLRNPSRATWTSTSLDMDLITGLTHPAVPAFPSYARGCRSSQTNNDQAPDPRLYDHAPQHARPSPRAYNPYQTSHPPSTWNNAYHRIVTNLPPSYMADNSEHSLRRKTPNGTIDNGYDGTPTQLAAGPPPQKYLNLAPGGEIFPTANSGHRLSASGSSWWYPSQPVRGSLDEPSPISRSTPIGGSYGQGSLGYSPAHGSLLPSPSAQLHPMNLTPVLRNGYGNTYPNQATPSPASFSPAGFNPAAIWGDGPFAGFHPNLQMSSGYPPHNIPYESGFVAVQAPLLQGGLGMMPFNAHNLPLQMQTPPYMLDDGYSRHGQLPSMVQSSHRGLQSMSLGPASPATCGVPSQVQFKEGVLATGHKAYTDLIHHLNRVKKVQHGKTNSRSQKNMIFPRPPKQVLARPTPHLQRAHQTFPGAGAPFAHRALQQPLNTPSAMNRMVRASDMLPSARLDANGRSISTHPAMMGDVYGNVLVQKYPTENARASLEILHSLCEQSEWNWVDGMLLGGCLHYALEKYEDALEWFKRIIDLNAK